MSRIRILPENLANQIAAGEVVERPASVVKELVENAIDAGADSLSIQIEGGGSALIRVVDNGGGMDQDDILLCLERHATSKLTRVDQLERIKTLGFRGEAVPSIASVSRMSLTSRPSGRELGGRVEVRFGKIVKVHEMGAPAGTVIEVRDLFGNLPARRKFLKSPRTELAHIEEVVKNYAFSRPDLAVTYAVNGREVFAVTSAGPGEVEYRLKKLMGVAGGVSLISLDGQWADEEVCLGGYLLPPEVALPGNSRMRVFVNGRPVRDKMLRHAVSEGLRNYLMKGRQPLGVFFLNLPAGEVDVNVHPAKQEVRFRSPALIHQRVVETLQRAMKDYQVDLKGALVRPSEPAPAPLSRLRPDQISEKTEGGGISPPASRQRCDRMRETAGEIKTSEAAGTGYGAELFELPPDCLEVKPGGDGLKPRVIGQLLNTFILCEVAEGFLIIDQHAAQERLIFERLRRQYQQGAVARQNLLFPQTLELSADQLAIVEENFEDLKLLGLELQEFGGSTYVIKAVPAICGDLPPDEVFQGVLEQFGPHSGYQGGRGMDSVLAGMACKAAIKARQPLEHPELVALVSEMFRNDIFSHCPHGRPVVRKFSEAEIRRWFYRT